jgi:hypothetical protein
LIGSGSVGGPIREATMEPVNNTTTRDREATIEILYKSVNNIFALTKASTDARATLS